MPSCLCFSNTCCRYVSQPASNLPRVLVRPFPRDVVRRVRRSGREVKEERLIRRHLLCVGDHRLRLLDEVWREVIALLRCLLGLGLRVVAHELRVGLIRVAAEEAVEPFEPAAEWPAVVRSCRRHRLFRRQVPLPDAVGVVAVAQENLREKPVFEWNVAVRSGIAGRAVREAGQMIGMVIAAGDDAGARRRAQRGRVHVGVQKAVFRERVDVGRGNRTAVAAEVPVPGVVEDDEEHIGRTFLRPFRSRPRWF